MPSWLLWLLLQCLVRAQAQEPANEQRTACYDIVMITAGVYAPPLGSLRVNKCTGETWELLAAPASDNSGLSANRWFPLTVETRERFLKQ